MEMDSRRSLIFMAGQAIYRSLVGVSNNHLHCNPSRGLDQRIDIAIGIMTGTATVGADGMLTEDVGKGIDNMTVRAGFRVDLTAVSQ